MNYDQRCAISEDRLLGHDLGHKWRHCTEGARYFGFDRGAFQDISGAVYLPYACHFGLWTYQLLPIRTEIHHNLLI
jgi:hypothetical protein